MLTITEEIQRSTLHLAEAQALADGPNTKEQIARLERSGYITRAAIYLGLSRVETYVLTCAGAARLQELKEKKG